MSGFGTVNDSVNHAEDYSQGYYAGTVVANTDSLGIARVQVNAPGLYDVHAGEVPYVGAIKDSPYGFGVGPKGPYGVYGFPQIGSTVMVELQNGDEHKPLYQTLLTAPSAHPWFNVATRWGFVDPSGNMLQVDMSANTWVWTHESGDSISYDGSGNVVRIIKGNETDTITGNVVRTIQGSVSDTIQGSETHDISGGLTFQVTGTANIQCSAFNLNSSGAASYTASVHQFHGPIVADSTVSAGGDITDLTASGNTQTMGDMRNAYNIHDHEVLNVQGGNDTRTSQPPVPQV